MDKETVKTIEEGSVIEYKYLPDNESHFATVIGIEYDGGSVFVRGVTKEAKFSITHDEIIGVIENGIP